MDAFGFILMWVVIWALIEPERFGHWIGRILFGASMRDPLEVERKRAWHRKRKREKG